METTRRIALLFFVALTLAPVTALACGPSMTVDQSRASYSEQIFVGRVLKSEVIESTSASGVAVTLYQLSVYVDDTLKGAASSGEIATVYVVAASTEEVKAQMTAGTATLSSSTYSFYDPPEAPEALVSYLFFARSFGNGEFVLTDNSSQYLAEADAELIETTRTYANNPNYYY
ncbi:MAG: hypothetical protein AUK47_08500 [Deltaproteobacteria bacterium CG2_30_63_29]|nr:MAG: hypothetical protein AUK47_08500 [Deltaproteobacteria bacterium CG2_30_63_29]PJB39082.1 MAG: hypothetical protein CO108_17845 [Deltaproteobacteria bacterium CG_4_9_14_3_um_filter_63_12]